MADALNVQSLEQIAFSHRIWSTSLYHSKNHFVSSPQNLSEDIPDELVGCSVNEVERFFLRQLDELDQVPS